MSPEKIEGLPPGSGGPQGTAIALARNCNIPLQQNQAAAQAHSGPSPDAIAAADEFVLDEIDHALGLIASYTTSAREAARRGDRDELRLRLRVQLRDCFRHAVAVHDLLSSERPMGGTG